ncbi:MAG: hypothetical protein HY248_01285, partial [Fimbriimonas ginsengisoli]|nr:hypothetical protein [Fimbriimonas ginsengisoli]
AAALDAGRAEAAVLKQAAAQLAEAEKAVRALHAEQSDLELQQKGIDDKVKKIDRELYGGKIVNPREVELLQKEIATLKRHKGDMDGRILQIWDEVPTATKALEQAKAKEEEARKRAAARMKEAVAVKTKLDEDFKRHSAARPRAAKDVEPLLLAKYESICKRQGGLGMAEVKAGACGECGNHLPERATDLLRLGRVVVCEQCHRILYLNEVVA